MKYQAVIFDLFGTLINIFSRREYENVVALMSVALKAPYDEFYKLWMQTANRRTTGVFKTSEENLEFICRELKLPATDSQIKEARKARFDYVVQALKPRNEAVKVLRVLKSSGYRTGLITNCSTEPPLIWPRTPFARLTDVAMFSSVCGLRKPDPGIFRLATGKLSVKPEECLFVGDGDDGELNGALEAGMHPVLIRDMNEESNDVIRNNLEYVHWKGPVITSLKEVLELVK